MWVGVHGDPWGVGMCVVWGRDPLTWSGVGGRCGGVPQLCTIAVFMAHNKVMKANAIFRAL